MRVLIACECSQVECCAFREKGYEAFSCDIQDSYGGHPEWHIKKDCFEVLQDSLWDLVIAHPPCTYLSNAGACRLFPGGVLDLDRFHKGLAARDFFMRFFDVVKCPLAVENPVPSKIFNLPPCDMIVNPFMFGDPFKKRTCFWLRGLPALLDTSCFFPGVCRCWVSGGSKNRKNIGIANSQRKRSQSFPGIAAAMADQWGDYVLRNGR